MSSATVSVWCGLVVDKFHHLTTRSRAPTEIWLPAVQTQFGRVRPGLTSRAPLGGELSELLDFVAGITGTVTL